MEVKLYKKVGKKLCIMAFIGIISLRSAIPVAASSILDTVVTTKGSSNHAEDISYSVLRGNNLNYGISDITQISSGEINVTGKTQCHRICDEVYLYMYLEQKDGNSYYTYKSWNYSTTDATHITKSLNVLVPRGHYYRLRGNHVVYEGGTRESISTITDGIWVD